MEEVQEIQLISELLLECAAVFIYNEKLEESYYLYNYYTDMCMPM